MFKNYVKIALRNFRQNKAYSVINVMGLALSIACAILIFSLVKYHLSFNTGIADASRTYRIVTEQHRDVISYTAGVPSPLGKAFRNDYNLADKVARIDADNDATITFTDGKEVKKFKEAEGVAFTEPEYFDIFNFPLLEGNKATVLTEPNTAIITEKLAQKYFGTADPINKLIRFNNKIDLKITGVLKNLPENIDQQCGIYISYPTLKQYNEWLASDDAWSGIESDMNCYVRLRPNVTPQQVEAALQPYVKKFRPTSKNIHHYKLQPLADIHFDSRYGGVMEKRNLWVLSFIGIFLLITACVNFINMATAQAVNRSKEIGVRKVLGGRRKQLFWQFISETAVITVLSVIIAVGLSFFAMPYINNWFNSHIQIHLFTDMQLLLFILGLTIAVTFLAGSYPGLILSGFKPIQALKNKIAQRNTGGLNTRRGLIVTQFAISQILIIAVIIIAKQMNYAKDSDLGFKKNSIVLLPAESTPQKAKTLKNELLQISGVNNVSLCAAAPASYNTWNTTPHFDNRPEEEPFRTSMKAGDEDYVKTFGLKIIAGRNLFASDSAKEFLVNETFVKKLNLTLPTQVLGKSLTVNGNITGLIVGVIKDFHDQSFYSDINAVCIASTPDRYFTYAVDIDVDKVPVIMAAVKRAWNGMNPSEIFSYEFLDEHIATFYKSEELMLKLIKAFSVIAIFIGCLGLYGLVFFMAAQKTKEIGIRKVLGGSFSDILWIFGKEFSKLIVIAFCIAAPAGYWLMNNWLRDFQFRIPISIWMFVAVVASTFFICVLTVSYQSIKAAMANPVKSLRSE